MDDLQQLYGRLRKYMYNILAIMFVGWGLTPFKEVFLGLILGTIISFINLRILSKRIVRFGEAFEAGGRARSLGLFLRMLTAVLGIAIVLQYPEQFHLISFAIGLMVSYAVIMADFFVQAIRTRDY